MQGEGGECCRRPWRRVWTWLVVAMSAVVIIVSRRSLAGCDPKWHAIFKAQCIFKEKNCLSSNYVSGVCALCVFNSGGVLSAECLGLSERIYRRMAISSARVWGVSGVTFGLSRGSVRALLSSKLPPGSCLLPCAVLPSVPFANPSVRFCLAVVSSSSCLFASAAPAPPSLPLRPPVSVHVVVHYLRPLPPHSLFLRRFYKI